MLPHLPSVRSLCALMRTSSCAQPSASLNSHYTLLVLLLLLSVSNACVCCLCVRCFDTHSIEINIHFPPCLQLTLWGLCDLTHAIARIAEFTKRKGIFPNNVHCIEHVAYARVQCASNLFASAQIEIM